jgi:DNA repair protein RadC
MTRQQFRDKFAEHNLPGDPDKAFDAGVEAGTIKPVDDAGRPVRTVSTDAAESADRGTDSSYGSRTDDDYFNLPQEREDYVAQVAAMKPHPNEASYLEQANLVLQTRRAAVEKDVGGYESQGHLDATDRVMNAALVKYTRNLREGTSGENGFKATEVGKILNNVVKDFQKGASKRVRTESLDEPVGTEGSATRLDQVAAPAEANNEERQAVSDVRGDFLMSLPNDLARRRADALLAKIENGADVEDFSPAEKEILQKFQDYARPRLLAHANVLDPDEAEARPAVRPAQTARGDTPAGDTSNGRGEQPPRTAAAGESGQGTQGKAVPGGESSPGRAGDPAGAPEGEPFQRPSRAAIAKQTDLVRKLERGAQLKPELIDRYQAAVSELGEMVRRHAMPLQDGERARTFPMLAYAPGGQPDILDAIVEEGGMLSPAKNKLRDNYDPKAGEYDGAPDLRGLHHQAVFGGRMMPDQMASLMHDRGFGDGTTDSMWNEINAARGTRATLRTEADRQAKAQAESTQQFNRFTRDVESQTRGGAKKVSADSLKVGDTVTVSGQKLKVIDVDPDTSDVTLEDHSKFGVQTVKGGQALYVERVQRARRSAKPEDNGWTASQESEADPDWTVNEDAPKPLAGEKINSQRTAYAPEADSLGVPREQMPQVASVHRGAMANFLKARGIDWTNEDVRPGDLKPSQADFNPGKVEKARGYADTDRRILVSNDDRVIDGHHQWMARMADHPDETMPVVRLDAPASEILSQLHEFPSAGMERAPDIDNSSPSENAPGNDSDAPVTNSPASAIDPEATKSYLADNGIPADRVAEAADGISRALPRVADRAMARPYAGDPQGVLDFDGPRPAAGKTPEPADGSTATSQERAAGQALKGLDPAQLREAFSQGKTISGTLRRLLSREIPSFSVEGQTVTNAADFAALLQPLRTPYFESLKIAFLDKANRIIHSQVLHVGTLNESIAHPRDLLTALQDAQAKSPGEELRVMMAHNHPSGDPTPSNADDRLTAQIRGVLEKQGVKLADHVITNGERFYSYENHATEKLRPGGATSAWEVVPRSELPKVQSNEDLHRVVTALRQSSDGETGHVIYLSTKNGILGIERVPLDQEAISKLATAGAAREGAHSVLLDLPFSDEKMADAAVTRAKDTLKQTGVYVTDAASRGRDSYANDGRLHEEPAAPISPYTLQEAPQRTRTIAPGATDAQIRDQAHDEIEKGAPKSRTIVSRTVDGARKDIAGIFGSVGAAARDVRNFLAPASAGPEARTVADTVRGEQGAGGLAASKFRGQKQLEGAIKAFNDMGLGTAAGRKTSLDIMDRIERGVPQADPRLQPFANQMRGMLDDLRMQIQALGNGKLTNAIQDYFPHIWKKPDAAAAMYSDIFAKRPLEGPAGFLKERSIDNLTAGVAQGLEPVSWNPAELTLLKAHEMNRYLMAQRIANELSGQGLAGHLPVGTKPAVGMSKVRLAGENYEMHPDGARIIQNYLSPGLRGKPVYDVVRNASSLLNQAQLGLSFFHAGFVTMDTTTSKASLGIEQIVNGLQRRNLGKAAEGVVNVGKAAIPLYAPIETIWRGSKVLQEYGAPGSVGGDFAAMTDALRKGGGRVTMDDFYSSNAIKSFKQAYADGNVAGAIIRAPMAAVEALSHPLMNWVVPRMKLGVFADMAREEIERLGPGATLEQQRAAYRKAWDTVDNRLGQVVYDNLFWNKTLKDSMMLGVRSVGWNLGTLRELGGGIADSNPKAIVDRLSNGDPLLTHRMAYAMALPILAGTAGAMIQYLHTGQGPQTLRDMLFPRTGNKNKDGSDERVVLPTYMKDVASYLQHPVQTAVNKVNPMISMMAEMYQNKDFYGAEIRNTNDPLMQRIGQEAKFVLKAPIPFSISGFNRRAGGGAGSAVESALGVTPAPASISRSAAENAMVEAIQRKSPAAGKTPEEVERSVMRTSLMSSARSGQDIHAQVQQLVQSHQLTPVAANRILSDARLDPKVRMFRSLNLDDAQRVYNLGTPAEKQMFLMPLRAKEARSGMPLTKSQ